MTPAADTSQPRTGTLPGLAAAGLALGSLALVALGVFLGRKVATGGAEALDVQLSVACSASADAGACRSASWPLANRRHRVRATGAGPGGVLLDAQLVDPNVAPRVLMIRKGLDGEELRIRVQDGLGRAVENARIRSVAGRREPRTPIRLPNQPAGGRLRVSIEPVRQAEGEPWAIELDEVGFFEDGAGLTEDERPFLEDWEDAAVYRRLLPRAIAGIALLGVLLLPVARRSHALALGAALAAATAFSASLLACWDARLTGLPGDLHAHLGLVAEEFPGSNLNYGLYMGRSLVAGDGPRIYGSVPWHRMPGYAFVVAPAVLLAGRSAALATLGFWVVLVQVAVISIASGFFFWAATRLLSLRVAGLAATLSALLPTQVFYTQIDSLMPAVALYAVAVACLYLARRRAASGAEGPSVSWDVLLHSGFALWFVLRPDVVPAWAVVSLVLHWRRPRRLLVPACLALAIGASWGAYRHRHTGEFVMTTNSFGASAMVGLWEVPNRFAWDVSDEAYHRWVAAHGLDPTSQAGNRFAVREVARFWLTYPGYVATLVWHELVAFVREQSFPGRNIRALPWPMLRGPGLWLLLCLIALPFALGFERVQTLLLGWPLLLNLPVFLVVYSSGGRFYNSLGPGLVATVLALVSDRRFWSRVRSRPRTAGSALLVVVLLGVFDQSLSGFLLEWEAFRYWAPLLDPSHSTLNVLAQD